VSFASPPPYEALQYTWENLKGPENHIPVKGNLEELFQIQLEDKQKCITYNLKEALDELRDETTLIRIWIDALCMGQKNMTEQSEQAKSMAKIYGQVSRVIVWLEETDLYVDMAFGILEEEGWATKSRILHYCAKKLKASWFNISEDAVTSLVIAELENGMWLDSPFQLLTTSESRNRLQRALSKIPMDFSKSTDPTELTAGKFRSSGTLTQYLVSGHDKLSESPDFLGRVKAIMEVCVTRSYWHRTWITQEIPNAASVVLICGERHMGFDMMALILLALSKFVPSSTCHLFKNGDENSATKFAEILKLPIVVSSRHELSLEVKAQRDTS
jgi:hypothetical protein